MMALGVPARAKPAAPPRRSAVVEPARFQPSAGFSVVRARSPACRRPRWARRRQGRRRARGRSGRGGGDGIDLPDRAVVGHPAVHLDLDVGRLRVDRRGEPRRSARRRKGPHGATYASVAPPTMDSSRIPSCPSRSGCGPRPAGRARRTRPASLARGSRGGHRGPRIGVHVDHVARARVRPSARVVHQPRGIPRLHEPAMRFASCSPQPSLDTAPIRRSTDGWRGPRRAAFRNPNWARSASVLLSPLGMSCQTSTPSRSHWLIEKPVRPSRLRSMFRPCGFTASMSNRIAATLTGVEAVGPEAPDERTELEERRAVEQDAGCSGARRRGGNGGRRATLADRRRVPQRAAPGSSPIRTSRSPA